MKMSALLLTLLFCGFVAAARAQTTKPVDVTFSGDETLFFVRGQSKEIKVSGKNLSVQAIETTPPGGVTLRETKEFVFDPKSHLSLRKGYKMFVLTIDISADAQTGDRMLFVVTGEGRSKPKPITVRDHVPVISNLKATVISRSKKEVKVDFEFADSAGDITPGSPPQVVIACVNIFATLAIGFARPETVTMKDAKSGAITAKTSFQSLNTNQCVLRVTVTDKNGNRSDAEVVDVEFK